MAAGNYDILVEQSATFRQRLTWKSSTGAAINLSGYTARLDVTTVYEHVAVVSLTTDNGGITLGEAAGTIDLLLTEPQTAALSAGRYVYNLELTAGNGGDTYRLLEGSFTVSEDTGEAE